jgi:6-pyruvoyltetrahydropterin/6-carboxytetrahydropterin synthase
VTTRASLTRRITFAAAHRYRRADWSEEKNVQVFGACANPHFHGHSYACAVTVAGEIDPVTGMVVDLGILDRVLHAEVRQRFDHKNINLDVPEFGEGKLIPTGENLARFIAGRVGAALTAHGVAAAVQRVVVQEDDSLAAEYTPER